MMSYTFIYIYIILYMYMHRYTTTYIFVNYILTGRHPLSPYNYTILYINYT